MLELHPFTGHVVQRQRAHRVVAPPYDALDPATRTALAATDPDSYLGALPPGSPTDAAHLETALAACRAHLERLFADGRYRPLTDPTVGVLALGSGRGRAVAIVADAPVTAFAALTGSEHGQPFADEDARVRPHEHVREERVAELTRYLEVVGVASSPVALTQRPDPRVTAATDAVTADAPDVAYRADDGVDVALWCVSDRDRCAQLIEAVADAGPAYLADGHHRGAAAVRYAARIGARPEGTAGRVLCAVLPSDHLTVQPFHRRFDDRLPTSSADAAIAASVARLRAAGVAVATADGPHAPAGRHRLVMTAAGRWWDLDVRGLARDDDLVEGLDVRLVDRDLAPLLTVPGAGVPTEAVPVPAPRGLDALVAPGAIGLALHPPPIETVLAVAAAGRALPAKTTYVTPKLRSGLVVTPRRGAGPPATTA